MEGKGKTQKMLERARESVANGEAVAIMAHNQRYAHDLARQVPGAIPLALSCIDHDINKMRGRYLKIFIDHHVWEIKEPWAALKRSVLWMFLDQNQDRIKEG